MNNNNEQNIRIGLLTSEDATNKLIGSGTLFYMWQSLKKHCGEVKVLGPVPRWIRFFFRLLNLLSKISFFILNKRYDPLHTLIMASLYARFFEKKLSQENKCDFIFAPVESTGIALLKSDVPIIYFSDATVAALIDYYPEFSHMWPFSKKEANHIESLALNKARLCTFSSSWAANSAHNVYGIETSKIRIFSLGANMDEIPPSSEVESYLQAKINSNTIKLLFLGTEWKRKGGDVVIDAVSDLWKAGEKAELTICGCIPPSNVSKITCINVIPFLDKKKNQDRIILTQLFRQAHFLFLPTRAECYGIVFCEAACFGVPVISTNTGGVSSIVQNGINGFLLPIEAKGSDYAKLISEIFKNKNRYRALANSSRKEYEERLNWDKWGISMHDEISALKANL